MNPTDFAWSSLQSITKLQPKDVKLIVDEIPRPTLETDSIGYVIHLSEPQKVRDNLYSLHGMYFDSDKNGRSSLWRMYRASVYHLCTHAVTTDYRVYKSLSNYTRSVNNLLFAISLVEDFAILGNMRSRWPGLLIDIAYASHVTSLRMKKQKEIVDPSTRFAACLLSYSLTGKSNITLAGGLETEVLRVYESLLDLEKSAQKHYSSFVTNSNESRQNTSSSTSLVMGLDAKKQSCVRKILDLMALDSLRLSQVPSPPFADNHGPNDLFDSETSTEESGGHFESMLKDACDEFSLNLSPGAISESEKQLGIESQTVLADWEYSLTVMKRLADLHKALDPETHFENFLFPKEDYSEFMRTRARLIGPIRLILDQLRSVRSSLDDVSKESGNIDINLAIQAVATKSKRNDVFTQEDQDTKSEAWAILIDSSKSLQTYAKEVKDIGVCLAEVAKDLIPKQNSWACYAFNENLYIIKDFSEIYGMRAKSRIGGLGTGLKTYLPDALRLAASRLKNTTEDIKVLLVASDGFPLGYEGIDGKLVEAIQEVNRSGIQLIGMGVGSSSIKKYFRSNCLISSPFDMMKQFVKIYLELATSF